VGFSSPGQIVLTLHLCANSVAETHRERVFSAQGGIPVVLDGILGAPRDLLGNVGPSVAQLLVHLDQALLFLLRPGVPLDIRPQLVVPPLPALLACTQPQFMSS
jgi:hypothetical protein